MGMNFLFPINLIEVNEMFISLARIADNLFESLSKDIINSMITIPAADSNNPRLEMLGIDSQNFLINGGVFLFSIAIWVTLLLINFFLKKIFSCFNNTPRLTRFVNYVDRTLKWNSAFELFFTFQIEI